MKKLFLIAITLFGLNTFAQVQTKKLKKITTVEDATAFIIANPDAGGELIEISEGTDSSATAKKLLTLSPGDVYTTTNFTYKALELKKSDLINAHYIYLNGDQLTLTQIDSIRAVIISKFKEGKSFSELAKEYNMDGNPNSELKLVPEGYLVKEFVQQVKEHKKGEVFKIDVAEKKWYYVAMKTEDEKVVKAITFLRIQAE